MCLGGPHPLVLPLTAARDQPQRRACRRDRCDICGHPVRMCLLALVRGCHLSGSVPLTAGVLSRRDGNMADSLHARRCTEAWSSRCFLSPALTQQPRPAETAANGLLRRRMQQSAILLGSLESGFSPRSDCDSLAGRVVEACPLISPIS